MKHTLQVYYRPILILILAFSFFTRIVRLDVPQRYIFDEVYHALTAKLIARGDPRAFEWWNLPVEPNTAVDWLHPPIAKYTQALAIKILGENSFAWRLSSVLFGVLVIAGVAKLADEIFEDKAISLLAAFLASLDGLLLVQSRIAMNDIHVTFFILLTLIFYQKKIKQKTSQQSNKYLLLTAISAGLAMGTKWSGLFVLLFVWLWEGLLLIKKIKSASLKSRLNWLITRIIILVIIPIAVYIASYGLMFYQGKSLICNQQTPIEGQCYFETLKWKNKVIFEGYISHFFELHRQIWWYQTNLDATHSYQSRPLQWFLDTRPVWFHIERADDDHVANIYSFGNPLLFWTGDFLIGITLIFLLKNTFTYLITKLPQHRIAKINKFFSLKVWKIKLSKLPQKNIKNQFINLLFVFSAYLIVWLPWQFSPRIMFFYHYTPAVPLLCIIIAYWLVKMCQFKSLKPIVFLVIILILLIFILWYPNWTAISMPDWWVNNLYFALKSWK